MKSSVGTQVDSYLGVSYYNDGELADDDTEHGEESEVQDNEEPVALKDVLRLVEQSAKAIDHMNDHQFSFVWRPCSSNTYGKKLSACLLFCFSNSFMS